ncbi:MAG: amino acid permease C-terminal domain-containing protein [Hymenobacter sp.]
MLVFLLFCVALAVALLPKHESGLPVLGLLINLYLMTQLGISNWTMFFVWLLLGLVVYFGYGYKNSKLSQSQVVGSDNLNHYGLEVHRFERPKVPIYNL